MSLVLAFDTSTPLGSVALGDGTRVLAVREIGSDVRHAESLLPAIAEVLAGAGCAPVDLTSVIVGGGPGSFTGVRIAAATARGLVRALGIPLFTYGSLLAEAKGADHPDVPVCALFDARRGEVYAACYRFGEGGWTTTLKPEALAVKDVVARIGPLEPVWTGEGARQHAVVLGGTMAEAVMPRAEALLVLARTAPDVGRLDDAAAWEPAYLRPPGAERIRR